MSVVPDPWDCPTLTIAEVAPLLGVPERRVREFVTSGVLTALPFGRPMQIATTELYRVLGLPVPAKPKSARKAA